MNTFINTLLLLECVAFFLFAIAFFVQKRMQHPVERIRLIQGTFLTVAAITFLICLPNAPRMNFPVFPKRETITEQRNVRENTTFPPQKDFIATPENIVAQTESALASNPQIILVAQKKYDAATFPEKRSIFPLKNARNFFDCALLSVFGVGVVYFMLFWFFGATQLRKILKNAEPMQSELLPKNVLLFASNEITTPLVCYSLRYCMRPVILVPSHLSGQSLRFALLHELSHISRGDLGCWYTLMFFAPLFWMQPFYAPLCRQLRLDQDFLADQNALRKSRPCTEEAEDYASLLITLARQQNRNVFPSTLSMGDSPGFLHRRIEMILYNERNSLRMEPRRHVFYGIIVLFAVLTLLLGTVRLKVVAENESHLKAETSDTSEKLVELVFTALAPDGKPVPGATVMLRYSDWYHPIEKTWTTDANGCVKTKIPALIIDTIHARFEVYHRERGLIGRTEFSYDKPEITDPTIVNCTLKKARRIVGRVVDLQGQPVENAHVAAGCVNTVRIAATLTDANGKFTLDTMDTAPLEGVLAFKDHIGYDFVPIDGERPQGEYQKMDDENWKNEKHNNGPILLKLEKQKPITIKVVDNETGKPLEGIMVTPSPINSVAYHSTFRTNGLESLIGVKTDVQGLATFDWLPPFFEKFGFHAFGSNPRFEKSGNARLYGKKSVEIFTFPNAPREIKLPQRAEIRGSVRLEDGSPVPWRQLKWMVESHVSLGEFTDHAGNFSFDINKNETVAVVPINDGMLIAGKQWIKNAENEGATPSLDFVLKKGTKVHGQIVIGQNREPYNDALFYVTELKGPDTLMDIRTPDCVFSTDRKGNYTIYLSPGFYHFYSGAHRITDEPIEIQNVDEIQINLTN